MKTLNKDLLLATKFASKNPSRPTLQTVCITDNKIVATDSYKLIEITNNSYELSELPDHATGQIQTLDKPILINAEEISKRIKFDSKPLLPIMGVQVLCNETEKSVQLNTVGLSGMNTVEFQKVNEQYPDYERIFQSTPPVYQVNVNAEFLIECLQAFKDKNGEYPNGCTLSFQENTNAPVVITGLTKDNSNKKVLIMPLKI